MTIVPFGVTLPPVTTTFTLEENQRFSRSMLWRLQRSFFERQGIGAWRDGTVPHYITSNAFIARAYAQVAFGFLRDCAAGAGRLALAAHDRPVYIVELGAGSGRFAYHFLKKFGELWGGSVLKDVPVTYVMTDFGEETLRFWRAHPQLRPLVESGRLDFARFDAAQPAGLALEHAGTTLAPGTVENPLIVLANYFFDSIPQDVFRVTGGQVYESLVSVLSEHEELDLEDPDLLTRVELVYVQQQAAAD